MKILHTADWHIGKKIYNQDLLADFDLFVDFLVDTIVERQVEVLLVSGDIFDQANPSAEARSQYFHSLVKLHKTSCKIIITGGNHDGVHMLNAPQELVKILDIHIVGGLVEDLDSLCIPIYKEGQLEVVVLAVPFLRDTDFRRSNEGYSYDSRLENIQMGIEHTYERVYELAREKYGDSVPLIAMGHLFTVGAITCESEREIQIGNQAAFDAQRFGKRFDYVALGHIHKPQKVNSITPTYYSGSPLPLSFSEREDQKRLLLIDTDCGFLPESIAIPTFRKLIRIQGDLAYIRQSLDELPDETVLPSFVEIILKEKQYDAEKIIALEQLVDDFSSDCFVIIHKKIHFEQSLVGTSNYVAMEQKSLAEIKPQEVFRQLLDQQTLDSATRKELDELFLAILEEESE